MVVLLAILVISIVCRLSSCESGNSYDSGYSGRDSTASNMTLNPDLQVTIWDLVLISSVDLPDHSFILIVAAVISLALYIKTSKLQLFYTANKTQILMQNTNTSSLSLPGLNPSNHAAAGSTSLGTAAAATGESIRKRNKNDDIEKTKQ